jgi:adenylosuccinate synthase
VITARDFTNEVLAFSDRLNIDISTATSENYNKALDRSENVLVEGAQGYSLGINSGFYPYTTSRECTPAQIMVDAGVPMRWLTKIVGTMRTYPIRVANRFNKDGEMIGWSGPCYSDQKEITFNDLGQPVELTTVTQLPRRIFTFSRKQTEDALRAVQPDEVFLNFVNYCRDEQHSAFIVSVINNVANNVGCGGVKYLGFGPTFDNVREL